MTVFLTPTVGGGRGSEQMDVFITAMALFSYTPAPHTPAHIQHTHTVPKLVENLSIQTEPVTAGAVATVHMSGFWARYPYM